MQNHAFRTTTMWLRMVVGLSLFVGALGCGQSEPDRWAEAQKQSAETRQAVSEDAVEGAAFNRFFPQVESPYDIVFKQEKTGFAQASLKNKGREVAVLSVSDTRNNPSAAEKFQVTVKALSGYPQASIGDKSTAILVGDRYQVQIRSMDPTFGPQEREAWLIKFDLDSIGRID